MKSQKKAPVANDVKITFPTTESQRNKFNKRCKKMGVSQAERLRQLVKQDLKG